MNMQHISKRTVDALQSKGKEYTVWDDAVTGFGVRVRASGAKSYIVVYRAGAGRGAPVRRFTIAGVGKVTAEDGRTRAKAILGAVALGHDPANKKTGERATPTVNEIADRFLADHIDIKRKPGTARFYREVLSRHVRPAFGTTKADKLTRVQMGRLHSSMSHTPYQANRVLATVGSLYTYAERSGLIPEGINPARRIDKFKESRRERFLTGAELERLGSAIREAETNGVPWNVDESKATAKHIPRHRRTKIAPSAAAAIRLLLFTGCRLREILNLKWESVDFDRRCLFLPDSKTGRKTIVLNAPALAVLSSVERVGPYVVTGEVPHQPRHDLHRPWRVVIKSAELRGVRIHDLRHTYASFGAGGGLGLPIIGRLLGHTNAATTARYAHLDNDPLRHASEAIAGRISAALDGTQPAILFPLRANLSE